MLLVYLFTNKDCSKLELLTIIDLETKPFPKSPLFTLQDQYWKRIRVLKYKLLYFMSIFMHLFWMNTSYFIVKGWKLILVVYTSNVMID